MYAAPLVFAAGAVSSIGPCVAPRFVAVAGLASGSSRRKTFMLVSAFVTGLVLIYASYGALLPLFGEAVRFSVWTYWLVSIMLAAGGVVALSRDHARCCERAPGAANASAGAAFLLGASFALVVSPCCAPLVVGILAYTSASGDALYAAMLLACFALGHALPIIAVAFGAHGTTSIFRRYAVRQASNVVSASLMLGLAAYYALLA